MPFSGLARCLLCFKLYSAYTMPGDADSYYVNGYQTVFLLNRDYSSGGESYTPVTDASIIPTFSKSNEVEIYAGHDGASGVRQVSGETSVPFTSGRPIQYSAAAEDGTNLQNYWITFVTQQPGTKLYVNAANDESRYVTVGDMKIPQREVLLISDYNFHHDVFFANIGDQDITGLYVKLENPQSVKLDDYWTVGQTTTLSAFTTTSYGDELQNVAKVRLQPEDEDAFGVIDGTLVIGYTGGTGEEIRIKLTGIAGTPKIMTSNIVDGIKYVPYSSVIQTNNMYQTDAITFTVEEVALGEGETLNERFGLDESVVVTQGLPEGLTIKPNGEIYGLPMETGTFAFSVTMAYKSGNVELSDSKSYTLTIAENTDENVEAANHDEQGYTVLDYASDGSARFRSEGPFSDFMDFYLDGRKLTEGEDYTVTEGSTDITLLAQLYENAGNGTHTIAAEFRAGGTEDGILKRSAQNLTVTRSSFNAPTPEVTSPENVPSRPPAPTPDGTRELNPDGTYTVRAGDTLWSIARSFYGNPTLWGVIYYANENIIRATNLIFPGQILIIP